MNRRTLGFRAAEDRLVRRWAERIDAGGYPVVSLSRLFFSSFAAPVNSNKHAAGSSCLFGVRLTDGLRSRYDSLESVLASMMVHEGENA